MHVEVSDQCWRGRGQIIRRGEEGSKREQSSWMKQTKRVKQRQGWRKKRMDGSWADARKRKRERERRTKMRRKKNSMWNPDRLCLGRSTVIQFVQLFFIICSCVYYCKLDSVYCLSLHSVYDCVPILLCISFLSSFSWTVLFCSALSIHACSIPIIQYANHCTVRYGTS